MENRKYRRVPFHAEAVIRDGEATITGTVDNLSMKGMLLCNPQANVTGNVLDIRIVLSGSTSELSINLKGKAIRQTDKGIAVEFGEMGLDSFTHLRNVIAYNSGDADAVAEEYFRKFDKPITDF